MGNWLNYKRILFFFLISIAYLSLNFTPKPWGFYGHKKINKLAVFTLPPSLFPLFKENINYISEHAVDPDKRRYLVATEGPCHFIDLDKYGNYVDSIPKNWFKAIEKYGEDSLRKHGTIPWHIQLTKQNLQKAFEEKNLEKILRYAADLGHYVGDAHVPLHTTSNYNGQFTQQKGIHGLWESRLVELFSEQYTYFVGKASYVPNVGEVCWKIITESHQAVDSVLAIEKQLTSENRIPKYSFEQRGKTTIQVYSKEFSTEYHLRLNKMVERRLKASILLTGCLWYTAWVDAGQPDLSNLMHRKLSKKFQVEFLENEQKHEVHNHSARDCE
jgi:hypothetical protein